MTPTGKGGAARCGLVSGATDIRDSYAAAWDAEDAACDALGIPRQAAQRCAQLPQGDRFALAAGVPAMRLRDGTVVALVRYPGEAHERVLLKAAT